MAAFCLLPRSYETAFVIVEKNMVSAFPREFPHLCSFACFFSARCHGCRIVYIMF